jgi:tryptophanyl-tRNA synthetase
MSKSDPSEQSRINLLDSPDEIRNKIKRCKTDPTRGLAFDDPARPECHNLLTLYQLLSGQSKEAVADECAQMGWGQFKPLFTEATIEALRPIQERYNALTGDRSQVEAVLRQGKEAAEIVAQQTLQAVKDALGFSQSL